MGHLRRVTGRVATASIALAATACPAHALEPVAGTSYASVGADKPLLVPGGGVAVFEGRPHEVRLNEIDPTTGARGTMFRRRLDRRVFVGAADLSVAGRVAGGRAVVSLASLYTTRDEFFH